MIGKTNRERGGETNSNTPNTIKTRKNVIIAVVTVTRVIENVVITTNIMDTGSTPTKKTGTTGITIIKDTGMSTRGIGNPGNNGTGTQKTMRTFISTAITTTKMPI